MLYVDLRPGQTCHTKVMHRKEVTHSDGSYEKKSRWRAWLKKWDKVKSHGTLIDWCTGREWPANCMTVISAWWRSNMPFQRLSGRLNYYITRWGQEVSELVKKCGRESQQKAELPCLRLSIRRTRKTTLMAIKVGVNMLQFCSVSSSLSHTQPFQIKWEVYFFLKKSSLVFIHCVNMYSACICEYNS